MLHIAHHRRSATAALLVAAMLLVATGCGSTADDASSTTTTPAGDSGQDEPTTTTIEGVQPSAGCEASDESTTTQPSASGEQTVTIDGVERTYVLSADGAEPGVPAPVVVLLHGMGMTAADINTTSDFPARAAEEGMIVVTPQALGTPTIWQPGAEGPDPAFLDQVLADLGQTHCIDESRVHVAGFSVGAVLATMYACARQDQIASIVTVTVEAPGGCEAPMPILSFHGTADPVIAYGNNDPAAPEGVTGTEANMAAWAETGKCQPEPTVTEVGSDVTRLEWPDCADGAEVVLYRVTGGGHDWPGSDTATTQDVSATDEALAFYGRHHL